MLVQKKHKLPFQQEYFKAEYIFDTWYLSHETSWFPFLMWFSTLSSNKGSVQEFIFYLFLIQIDLRNAVSGWVP